MGLHSPIDGGYAWIVLAGGMLQNAHFGLYVSGMGILMVEYVHYFHISVTEVSWISTSAMVIGPLIGKNCSIMST